MNRNIFASLLAMLVLCTATFAQKKAKKDSTDNEKVIVVEIDNSNILIGVQKLSERVALPEGNGEFYAVVMVVYDTTYSRKTGKIKKVVADDYIVHMHKGSYDKFKNLRGICYMHAKWSKKNANGFYVGTKPPRNLGGNSQKICMVYAFGEKLDDSYADSDDDYYDYTPQPNVTDTSKNKSNPYIQPKTNTGGGTDDDEDLYKNQKPPCARVCPRGMELTPDCRCKKK